MSTYILNQAATALATAAMPGNTLQAPQKGLGMQWRAAGYTAPNTRAAALAAVLGATGGEPFTLDQAQAALQAAKANGLNLGSGSPRSYVVAFTKNGYFAPAAAAPVAAAPVAATPATAPSKPTKPRKAAK